MSLYRTVIEMMVFFILALAAMTVPAMGKTCESAPSGRVAAYQTVGPDVSLVPPVALGGLPSPDDTAI